ncbi:unnamed protein product [Vicia faba]|uniref:Uncharacterized protein n=1 Tax=Vicia faba TaxID=3906 RepID=A0AAV0YW09_VICFA|nr:unnamed protein product [Vicia faba]
MEKGSSNWYHGNSRHNEKNSRTSNTRRRPRQSTTRGRRSVLSSENQSSKKNPSKIEVPNNLKRLEEYALGMTCWANEILPTLYADPPRFGPSYLAFYVEHIDHMLVHNLQEHFNTSAAMKTYIAEQYQALSNR